MASFGLYDSTEVFVNFGGFDLDDMRADEFCKFSPVSDEYGEIVGSDGSVTRFSNNNTLWNVELTFKSSSKVHATLSAIYTAGKLASGGADVASLIIKDQNGSSILASEKAWIVALPEKGFGKEVGPDVSWMIRCQCQPGQVIVGGNQL